MIRRKSSVKKKLFDAALFALVLTLPITVFASTGNLDSFKGVSGLKSFIGDVQGFLLIMAPTAAVCCSVFFAIRRSAADEQEGKMWTKRIITAWIGCAVALLSTGILELLNKYIGA